MTVLRRLVIALAAGVVVVLGGARLLPPAPAEPAGPRPAHVVHVTDGDTIVVRLASGRRERVRYIGMDTPESVKPGTPVQCYAKAAARANRGLVAGRDVVLVPDAERRDRYGRLLAYVYRSEDKLFVNAELVRRGFARPLTIPPNVAHERLFRRLAREARARGAGLWSHC